MLAADLAFVSDYWNVMRPTDVNADGFVAPDDAILVINSLNNEGGRALVQGAGGEGPQASATPTFFDVDNDGYLSPSDAIMVINELNAEGEGPNGELMQYEIRLLKPGSQGAASDVITTPLNIGDEFDLQVRVRDLRLPTSGATGVFAGYLDLAYEDTLANVRLYEVQTVTLDALAEEGTFTLTLNGETTGPIAFDPFNFPQVATNMRNALAALPGVGGTANVIVEKVGAASARTFDVNFVGKFYDTDIALMAGSGAGLSPAGSLVTIAETVNGNPTTPAGRANAFAEAFRTRAPALGGAAGPYDGGLFALDEEDLINELGAFGPTTPVGAANHELVRARMKATAAGTLTFTPSAEVMDRPFHNTVMYQGSTGSAVAVNQILFLGGAKSVTIIPGPINADPDIATVVEDTVGGVLIPVLANDEVNPPTTGTLELRAVGSAGAAGTTTVVGNQVRFTPAANFNGTANFTYTVGIVGNPTAVATGSVSVTVTAVNDAPVNSVPGAQTVAEGATRVFSTANGNLISISDVDAGTANVQTTLNITNGTLTLSGIAGLNFTAGTGTNDTTMTFTGTIAAINTALAGLTFTPNADFPPGATGTAALTITTNDQGNTGGAAATDSDTVNITVTGVNDAPVNTVPLAQNVTFIETLAFSAAAGRAITVSDVDAGTANIRVTLTVTAASAPGTLGVTLPLPAGVTATGNGTATLTLTGPQAAINTALNTLVFDPTDAFIGTATLTVTTNDQGASGTGGALSATSNITINVIPPTKPFALADSVQIVEGNTAPQTIDVLANDLFNDGKILELLTFTQPTAGQGTVALDNGGTPGDGTDDQLIFTGPGGDFFGDVIFTYTINETVDPAVPAPPPGTVTVRITNVNDAPVAVADPQYQGSTDANLVVSAAQGVLANDTDPDNLGGNVDPLTAVLVPGSGPASGTLSFNADGSFTYIPAGGGTFSFSYRARDAAGLESAPAIVTIAVSAPPTANPDGPFTATEDTPFTSPVSLVANDQDFSIPPTPLTAVLETNVPTAAGTVVINGDNTFTYTPALNFNTTRPATGPVTFTYRASAAGRLSAPATVTINVTEVNDNPTANPDTFQAVKRNGAVGLDQPVAVLGNDSSAPDGGETLSVISVSPATTPLGGSVRVEGGVILYTSPSVTGTDTFDYTISDGRGGTATATVTVTVVDFVPKDVSGHVFVESFPPNGVFDNDLDGIHEPGEESGLGGVRVILTGTDFTGATIGINDPQDLEPNVPGITRITAADGSYSFVGLRPGNYTLREVQPPFMLDGIDSENSPLVTKPAGTNDTFTMTWLATDQSGPITGLNFGENGPDLSQLVDARGVIQELQASSQPPEGFWLATDLSGNARWSFTLNGWENCASVSFDLNSNLSGGILTVTDMNGTVYTRSMVVDPPGVNAGNHPRIRIIGTAANGDRIIRIDATAAEMGLTLLPNALAAAAPQGEGEAAQFAESADAVFANSAWA